MKINSLDLSIYRKCKKCGQPMVGIIEASNDMFGKITRTICDHCENEKKDAA